MKTWCSLLKASSAPGAPFLSGCSANASYMRVVSFKVAATIGPLMLTLRYALRTWPSSQVFSTARMQFSD